MMKKISIILGVYFLIVLAVCAGVSCFAGGVPELIAGAAPQYRFVRGIFWFFCVLPTVLLSGITVACSIQWSKNTSNSMKRFSEAMMVRYRKILIVSVVVVLILSLGEEVFKPLCTRKMQTMKNAPAELSNALSVSESLLNDNRYVLAWQYANKAVAVAPKSEEAKEMLKRTKDALDSYHDEIRHSKKEVSSFEKEAKPLHTADKGLAVRELVERARSAEQNKNWFEAHYWANLAAEVCSGTDTNRPEALRIASLAWSNLSKPGLTRDDEENKIYTKKRDGYKALLSGDNLKAYYIFNDLNKLNEGKKETSQDPDVLRFYALAKENVEKDYFFIDETEGMERLENNKNIYFSLKNPDSTLTVYFIRGAMDIRKDGGLVRYLDDVTMVTYDEDGKFIHYCTVPYAKVMAYPVKNLPDEVRAELGIEKKWTTVPYILLQSVDRETEDSVCSPKYFYEDSGVPDAVREELKLRFSSLENESINTFSEEKIIFEEDKVRDKKNPTYLILPMPFSDFAVISEASRGSEQMSFPTLNKIITKAQRYGFSKEVLSQSLVCRGMYPVYILIMCIFSAILGWSYRVEDEKMRFKFAWVLALPLAAVLQFVLLQLTGYLYRMINYVIVGTVRDAALLVAAVFYLIIFMIVSTVFAARKV